MSKSLLWRLANVWMLIVMVAGGAALAQDEEESEEKKKNWSNKTELGLTATTGNSDTTNFSLGNEYKRTWERAEFTFDLLAIKNESTIVTYGLADPTNTATAFLNEETQTTAETAAIGLAYRRQITGRMYWYANTSWFRNVPAGIDDRYRAGAGVGYLFVETARHVFKGEVGLNYTDESQTSGTTLSFGSGALRLDYNFKISETAEFSSVLEGFGDWDDTSNWQVNWINSVTASMNSNLALKVSYAVVYDNQPANILIPPGAGAPAGAAPLLFVAKKTDTFLTASVVLNF